MPRYFDFASAEEEARDLREAREEANAEQSRQALLNRLDAEEALLRWKEDHGYA